MDSKIKNEYNTIVRNIEEATHTTTSGVLYFKNEFMKEITIPYITETSAAFPGIAALYLISNTENDLNGKKIRFVEENEQLVKLLRKRNDLRISKILVTKEEAGKNPIMSIHF